MGKDPEEAREDDEDEGEETTLREMEDRRGKQPVR